MQVEVMAMEVQLKTLRTLVLSEMTSIAQIAKLKFKEMNSNALLVDSTSEINDIIHVIKISILKYIKKSCV
jgi:hypothetical protein